MKLTDDEIFLQSNSIISNEEFEHLFNSTYNLRYIQKQFSLIEEYKYYFITPYETKEPTKIYINKTIRDNFNKFFETFLELFGGCEWGIGRNDNFFEIDYNKKQNAPNEFQKDMDKIKNLSFECSSNYKKYRKIIKQELGI